MTHECFLDWLDDVLASRFLNAAERVDFNGCFTPTRDWGDAGFLIDRIRSFPDARIGLGFSGPVSTVRIGIQEPPCATATALCPRLALCVAAARYAEVPALERALAEAGLVPSR